MPTLADYKAPYPAPTADQKRYVIYLDPKQDEDYDYKVELIPGRIEMVDGGNRHFIGGKIKEETVQGWGYDYHVVQLGPMAGTLMMMHGEEAQKKPKFVGMAGTTLIRYNSKLPIVVYVPKNAELHYRIWSATGGAEGILAKEE